jgi:hypothetical protein
MNLFRWVHRSFLVRYIERRRKIAVLMRARNATRLVS